ncbi:MAG: DUF2877 domain-containing protein [Caldisericia bacterium]|nr:DUF2877 domain-containing protein [Caldisericia bacterium]
MILVNCLEKKFNIISIGDCIEDGEYLLHSSFNNSINFYKGDKILTIGNTFIGRGPTNIISNDISIFRNIHCINKKRELIIFEEFKFEIDNSKIYESKLKIDEFNIEKLYNNINLFENYVKIFSNGKGLSPLLGFNFYENDVLSNKFIFKIKNGIEKIISGNLINGINEIKGVGIGLTPSGDDFIYGFLVGINIFEIIQRKKFQNIKKLIYETAKSDNLISNNFLYFASEGMFFEKTKNLIISLFFGNESQLLESTTKILQIGETSGVDFCVGLIFALKKGGEDVCKRFN